MPRVTLPIGTSNFAEIRREGWYYVDKTGLIRDLLNTRKAKVTLITRPRRFGKIQDTGEGIPEERIPYIFDKGYSGDGGSGIGLYICQDVVKYHGGSLTLASTGPGGTTFRILLPRTPEAAQPDQPNPTHPEEG